MVTAGNWEKPDSSPETKFLRTLKILYNHFSTIYKLIYSARKVLNSIENDGIVDFIKTVE
ncbi:hypothetical protein N7475_008354 [Penicillium sp. IBT 31633x]|nr:hypothetical protein N7475_008354 [Penicillium sp. IBT 31633x]